MKYCFNFSHLTVELFKTISAACDNMRDSFGLVIYLYITFVLFRRNLKTRNTCNTVKFVEASSLQGLTTANNARGGFGIKQTSFEEESRPEAVTVHVL